MFGGHGDVEGPAGLIVVVPVTSRDKHVRSHVRVEPPEGGLRTTSYINCEDVRSVASARLTKRMGKVSQATLQAVAMRLRVLMDLQRPCFLRSASAATPEHEVLGAACLPRNHLPLHRRCRPFCQPGSTD